MEREMFDVTIKRKFVISAVNFYEGGPLTLLVNLLSYLDSSELSTDIDFIILVHNCFKWKKEKN